MLSSLNRHCHANRLRMGVVLILATILLSISRPLGAAEEWPLGWECPKNLAVQLQVGLIEVDEQSDPEFRKYLGARLDFRFQQTSHPNECLLSEEGGSGRPVAYRAPSSRRASFLLRKKRNGQLQAILEGYTPNGKLYAAQSRLQLSVTQDWTGRFDAFFYDASGTIPKKLGPASLLLSTY